MCGSTIARRLLMAMVVSIVFAAPLAAQQPLSVPSDTLPEPLKRIGIVQRLDAMLPLDSPFLDSAGHVVTLREYFGHKPVVLTLVYYDCPLLCSYALSQLIHAMRPLDIQVGREFDVVVVSFNPAETPALAATRKQTSVSDYGRPEASSGFHFLTGDRSSIQQITEAVGFAYDYDDESGLFVHTSAVIVATAEGRISRYLLGVDYPPRDLKFALMEATEGRIGSPVDRVLLYCYQYDPARGRYGVLVMRLLRIAAGLTIIGLASFIGGSFWLQRRHAPRTG